MSSDAFAPAAFPRLREAETVDERERARIRGYADGHAEGYRAAAAAVAAARAAELAAAAEREAARERELSQTLEALQRATMRLDERMRALAGATAERVHGYAIDLAELILAAEVATGEDSAAAALRRALAAVEPGDIAELRLHPDDHALLAGHPATPHGLVLTPAPDLARGDAIVVVADGFVDARIGAALERARAAAGAAS